MTEKQMTTIDAKQFREICDRVWTERAMVLRGRGQLSGEATLVRAVFWRLCKAGIKSKGCAGNDGSNPPILAYHLVVNSMLKTNARPAFDAEPILNELVERYQNEVGQRPAP
jgi:hypothetical protein